jgi:hypothetical protein
MRYFLLFLLSFLMSFSLQSKAEDNKCWFYKSYWDSNKSFVNYHKTYQNGTRYNDAVDQVLKGNTWYQIHAVLAKFNQKIKDKDGYEYDFRDVFYNLNTVFGIISEHEDVKKNGLSLTQVKLPDTVPFLFKKYKRQEIEYSDVCLESNSNKEMVFYILDLTNDLSDSFKKIDESSYKLSIDNPQFLNAKTSHFLDYKPEMDKFNKYSFIERGIPLSSYQGFPVDVVVNQSNREVYSPLTNGFKVEEDKVGDFKSANKIYAKLIVKIDGYKLAKNRGEQYLSVVGDIYAIELLNQNSKVIHRYDFNKK